MIRTATRSQPESHSGPAASSTARCVTPGRCGPHCTTLCSHWPGHRGRMMVAAGPDPVHRPVQPPGVTWRCTSSDAVDVTGGHAVWGCLARSLCGHAVTSAKMFVLQQGGGVATRKVPFSCYRKIIAMFIADSYRTICLICHTPRCFILIQIITRLNPISIILLTQNLDHEINLHLTKILSSNSGAI
jgi:hypothetical protein